MIKQFVVSGDDVLVFYRLYHGNNKLMILSHEYDVYAMNPIGAGNFVIKLKPCGESPEEIVTQEYEYMASSEDDNGSLKNENKSLLNVDRKYLNHRGRKAADLAEIAKNFGDHMSCIPATDDGAVQVLNTVIDALQRLKDILGGESHESNC